MDVHENFQMGVDPTHKKRYKSQFNLDDDPLDTRCILCEDSFVLPTNEQDFLSHLFQKHRLVIGDVWAIASLKSYVNYWRVKFQDVPITHYCTTVLMDCTPDGKPSTNETYFLLSDCTSEDKTLRDELYRSKLEWVLAQQSDERSDTNFKRGCMFCRTEFTGPRSTYIDHLSQKHNLHLGKPENLVFLDKFLDKIQNNIESLICIYCKKNFKDRVALKEHMRKKLHKRINPNDTSFDKFYINNYLERNQTWRQKQKTNPMKRDDLEDASSENEDEDNWSDWDEETTSTICLFCNHNENDFPSLLEHIKSKHNFNFEDTCKKFPFYQKVKLVNFIRSQTHSNCCVFCNVSSSDVIEHMAQEGHCRIPKQRIWDQPEFYFPMHENDSFLYYLDADSDSEDEKENNHE